MSKLDELIHKYNKEKEVAISDSKTVKVCGFLNGRLFADALVEAIKEEIAGKFKGAGKSGIQMSIIDTIDLAYKAIKEDK